MGSISSDNTSQIHVVIFPFMSKGHTIPTLHLAKFLLRRLGVAVTVFTTPANRPFISTSLSNTTATIIDIPYPENIPDIPSGVESTDKLPSMSLYVPFTRATKLMQPDFERALEALPPVTFLVSDGFLWWTLESANKFGLPRFVFYGMNNYAMVVSKVAGDNRLFSGNQSANELVTLPELPWIKVSKSDFDPLFSDPEPKGPMYDLVLDQIVSSGNSYGFIMNSFYDLEPAFIEFFNRECKPKGWNIGPLCLADEQREKDQNQKPSWIKWLDRKLEQNSSVLYVAFGSQAEISPEQLKETANGLEDSGVNFLWVIRKSKELELGDGFEERIKDRGILVKDWVDQREILRHESVKGFLSHCGWNSVMESICEGVPILAFPMMAEQPMNARMVVEEIKVGLRVESCDGSMRGFVKREGLAKMSRELMEGEMGKEVRKRVKEVAEMAKKAVEEETGSSWKTLDLLLKETCELAGKKKEPKNTVV